jgi:hypothetical protein
MTSSDPFDSRPDPVLGSVLRRHLDGHGDHAAFADRVLAHLAERGTLWEVLARWTRPGIAAAVLAAALAGYWLVLQESRTPSAEPTAELAATDQPLDRDALMGVVLGTAR